VTQRIGIGYDVHPFDASRRLVLGGVALDHVGLAGHSDADAVVHAVADAVLGPCGLPDLGTLFPASDDAYRGVSSLDLLRDIAGRVRVAGWWIANIDVVIAAEAPPLAPYIEAMAANIAAAVAPAREPMGEGIHVSVKAKRGEGIGAIGRSEGIAVWAVASLERG
jgi:2-C-methyl-D-erythritol 2,4-cyclodiphosphate synthase